MQLIKKINQRIINHFQPDSFMYFETQVYCPKGSFLYKKVLADGIYESENVKIITSLISENSTYLDIGSNIGLMAIPILNQCQSCSVVSYEPSPNTVKYLKHTVKHSYFRDRWHIRDKAIGKEIGNLEFCIAPKDLGAYDGFRDTQRIPIVDKVTVPVSTLDSEWETLGNPKVSVIKIDTEGAEMEVLKGATECITKERPYILLEWNAKNLAAYNITSEGLLQFANNYQYSVYSTPCLIPVHSIQELELQMINTESFLLVPV